MFINDLPLHITSKNVDTDIYADDTTLTASADVNSIPKLRQDLTNSFKEVEDWATANKLPLSEAKSKSALVTGKRLLDKIDQDDRQLEIPATNGHVLEQFFCATVLRLDIDVPLNFTCHVDKVCEILSKRIGILNKIKTCLPLKQRIIFKYYDQARHDK